VNVKTLASFPARWILRRMVRGKFWRQRVFWGMSWLHFLLLSPSSSSRCHFDRASTTIFNAALPAHRFFSGAKDVSRCRTSNRTRTSLLCQSRKLFDPFILYCAIPQLVRWEPNPFPHPDTVAMKLVRQTCRVPRSPSQGFERLCAADAEASAAALASSVFPKPSHPRWSPQRFEEGGFR